MLSAQMEGINGGQRGLFLNSRNPWPWISPLHFIASLENWLPFLGLWKPILLCLPSPPEHPRFAFSFGLSCSARPCNNRHLPPKPTFGAVCYPDLTSSPANHSSCLGRRFLCFYLHVILFIQVPESSLLSKLMIPQTKQTLLSNIWSLSKTLFFCFTKFKIPKSFLQFFSLFFFIKSCQIFL